MCTGIQHRAAILVELPDKILVSIDAKRHQTSQKCDFFILVAFSAAGNFVAAQAAAATCCHRDGLQSRRICRGAGGMGFFPAAPADTAFLLVLGSGCLVDLGDGAQVH